ncbi:hypothetical protein D3C76_925960 [compost metagenome]
MSLERFFQLLLIKERLHQRCSGLGLGYPRKGLTLHGQGGIAIFPSGRLHQAQCSESSRLVPRVQGTGLFL